MRLSEKLKRDHECGDFGNVLAGYHEQALSLECRIDELESAILAHRKQFPDEAMSGDVELWSHVSDLL